MRFRLGFRFVCKIDQDKKKDEVILIKRNNEQLFLDMLYSWHRSNYLERYRNLNGTVNTVLQLTNSKLVNLYDNSSEVYKNKSNTFYGEDIACNGELLSDGKLYFVRGWILRESFF